MQIKVDLKMIIMLKKKLICEGFQLMTKITHSHAILDNNVLTRDNHAKPEMTYFDP